MATNFITDENRSRIYIYRNLCVVTELPNVTIRRDPTYESIWIECGFEFVPNIRLVWAKQQKHFRVYMHMTPNIQNSKENAGYAVMNVRKPGHAQELATFFKTLHHLRPAQKNLGDPIVASYS